MRPRYFALVPAAGGGNRFGADVPKQYAPLAGQPLLAHTLRALAESTPILRTYVVLAPDDRRYAQLIADRDRVVPLMCGGATRAESVTNGLQLMRGEAHERDWVLVHDAARPCLADADLRKLVIELGDDPVGGLLAVRVADTLKHADGDERVDATPPRDGLWQAQTPQMFRYATLLAALADASARDATDEAQAIERLGLRPKLVEGNRSNIKVTFADDLALAEAILRSRTTAKGQNMRIGTGFDVHALISGRKLIIGGVTIPYERGLEGHSDADVLLHAICDALLGAAALGDIGRHFPDNDARYRGVDSRILLRSVRERVAAQGWRVANVDATVIAQAPKLAPYIAQMVTHIAADLGVDENAINVKATTTERLGFIGRGEGIAAEVVALLLPLNGDPA